MRLLGMIAAFALLLAGIAEARQVPPTWPAVENVAMPELEYEGRILQACRGWAVAAAPAIALPMASAHPGKIIANLILVAFSGDRVYRPHFAFAPAGG